MQCAAVSTTSGAISVPEHVAAGAITATTSGQAPGSAGVPPTMGSTSEDRASKATFNMPPRSATGAPAPVVWNRAGLRAMVSGSRTRCPGAGRTPDVDGARSAHPSSAAGKRRDVDIAREQEQLARSDEAEPHPTEIDGVAGTQLDLAVRATVHTHAVRRAQIRDGVAPCLRLARDQRVIAADRSVPEKDVVRRIVAPDRRARPAQQELHPDESRHGARHHESAALCPARAGHVPIVASVRPGWGPQHSVPSSAAVDRLDARGADLGEGRPERYALFFRNIDERIASPTSRLDRPPPALQPPSSGGSSAHGSRSICTPVALASHSAIRSVRT